MGRSCFSAGRSKTGLWRLKDSGSRVLVTQAEIVERFPEFRVESFGDAIILPGLINTHTHLELTAMRGYLENEET